MSQQNNNFVNKNILSYFWNNKIKPLIDGIITRLTTIEGNGFVPAGGTSGQFLRKTSSTNYALGWSTIYQAPAGGSTGQVLKKTSAASGAYTWQTPYEVPSYGSPGQVLTKTNSNYAWEPVPMPEGSAIMTFNTNELYASAWTSDNGYDLYDSIILDPYLSIGSIQPTNDASDEAWLAWSKASPRVTYQQEGYLYLKCLGEIPEVDIPVTIEVISWAE